MESSLICAEIRGVVKIARHRVGKSDSTLRLAVAVSGGEDSHVLLAALHSLRAELNLELVICHLNHGLRAESEREARFVGQIAGQYALPLILQQAEARPLGANVEAWAREVRYGFLDRCLANTRSDFIVTAHHLHDQAETVLFRLLSGRILTDSTAIARLDLERKLLRPLLNVPRTAIEDFSVVNRLSFVVDGTNFDRARTRSRIRHDLLPLLVQQYNPRVVSTLGAVSRRLAEDEEALWVSARQVLADEIDAESVASLTALLPGIRWRVLQLIAERHVGKDARKLGYRRLQRIEGVLEHPPKDERPIDLGFGILFLVDRYRRVIFRQKRIEIEVAPERKSIDLQPAPLPIPGAVSRRYGDGTEAQIQARIVERSHLGGGVAQLARQGTLDRAAAYFDARQLNEVALVVRERRDGDLVRVWNRGGRKLKKLMQEQGVLLTRRNCVPIVEWDGNILWVPGVARSEFAPVGDHSDLLLELSYVRK